MKYLYLFLLAFLIPFLAGASIASRFYSPTAGKTNNEHHTENLSSFMPVKSNISRAYAVNNNFYRARGGSVFTSDLSIAKLLPKIVAFTPAKAGQGVTVTIKGSGFASATAVKFGGVPAASYHIVSDSEITAVVAGSGASGSISITTAAGTVSHAGFTYLKVPVITGFSPAFGSENTFVVISGQYFTGASSVKFGGLNAIEYTVVSDNSIKARPNPKGASGDVSVQTSDGTGSKSGFTFMNRPVIAASGPTTASSANAPTLSVTPLAGYTYVWKNGIKVVGTGPSVLANLSGAYTVTATFDGQTSTSLHVVVQISPELSPKIVSFTPAKAGQGTTVTIEGEGFTGTTAVKFGGVPAASYHIVSDSEITAVVANSGASGDVAITNAAGAVSHAGFTYLKVPVITGFSPAFGSENTFVVISGRYFTGASSVKFGGLNAIEYMVVSDHTIKARPNPKGASGDVSVQTSDGTGSKSGFTFMDRPVIAASGPTTALSTNAPTLSVTPLAGYTYVWKNGIKVVGKGSSVLANLSGAYTVTATFKGQTSTSLHVVVQIILVKPVITASGPTTTVNTNPPTLSVTPLPGYTYTWKNNDKVVGAGTSIVANKAGIYTATANYNGKILQSLPVTVSINFTLPPDNFKITNTAASCKGSGDGAINITAQQNLNYTATVVGSAGIISKFPFNTSLNVNNLSADIYSVCITIDGQPTYQQCFSSIITEPKDLSVYAAVIPVTKQLTVSLDGASSYNVTLNGVTTTTTQGQVTLQLKSGINTLTVSTDRGCQGIYTQTIELGNGITLFPNPFTSEVNIDLGSDVVKDATIRIYDTFNKVIYNKQYANQAGIVRINLANLMPGGYIVEVITDGKHNSHKIIKN